MVIQGPPYVLTPPTAEPLSVAEAKEAARLEGEHWDEIVRGAITTARRLAEHTTGRALVKQVRRYELNDWPAADDLFPDVAPSAVAVSYWNGSAWASLSSGAYAYAPGGPGRLYFCIAPVLGSDWPTLGEAALGPRVRIDVTVGSENPRDVPPEAVQFVKAAVGVIAYDPSLSTEDLSGNPFLWRLLDPLLTAR